MSFYREGIRKLPKGGERSLMQMGNISLINIFCLFLNKDWILHKKAQNFLVHLIDDLILASKDINVVKSLKTKLQRAFKMIDLGTINSILDIGVQRKDGTEKIRFS